MHIFGIVMEFFFHQTHNHKNIHAGWEKKQHRWAPQILVNDNIATQCKPLTNDAPIS